MTPLHASERGMALVAVLLMTCIMAGLAAAMAMSGRTEVAMSTNEGTYAGARAAAEAGLNHAAVLALDAISHSSPNAILQGPDLRVDTGNPGAAVNADNGSLAALVGGSAPWPVASGDTRYTYDLIVVDDDDPSLYPDGLSDSDRASIGEDGAAATDLNGRLVVRATGFGPGGARAQFETMLAPTALPAILVGGSLSITGSPAVTGTSGSIHANQNLTITGTKTSIAKNATASGTYTKPKSWSPGGYGGGNAPQIPVPGIQASDYLADADLVLTSTGLILNRGTQATLCNASSKKTACKGTYGWTFSSASAGWTMNGSTGVEATYYVQGPATLSSSPGTSAKPMRMGVIATGSITITGSPKLAPEASSGVLFVTGGDLKFGGNLDQSLSVEGRILVHEQMAITAGARLNVQIAVEDSPSVSTLVKTNVISGSPKITYNATLPSMVYSVSGWREGR